MDTVTVKHMRKAGYCIVGAKKFADRYNLDFKKFIKEGLPADKLEQTGDALGIKLAEIARAERQ